MSERSLSIVALVQFLRTLSCRSSFAPPPLRATIVFDDPNVRWRSYGFIDYRALVAHADANGYHASMAMVPLDAVGAHNPTVSLFRQRRDRLSLAFHGNDHVKRELLAPTDHAAAAAMCAQALRRVMRFETHTGLTVDRVMIPPHGMYSQSVATALAAFRFDALCAIHPEPGTGMLQEEHHLAGWGPATFAGPTAVIPRFPLDSSRTDVALRAFMDNPLVLYGHHEDLASGLDLLRQAADHVNALGDVRWSSLGEMAASNVATWTGAGRLEVRPYSGSVRVGLPEGAQEALVAEPGRTNGTLSGWSRARGPLLPFDVAVPCGAAEEIHIRLRARDELALDDLPVQGLRPWAAARRATTEARDRMMPLGRLGPIPRSNVRRRDRDATLVEQR